MWDKFFSGVKYKVRLEVMKSTVTSFDEAANIALRVESSICCVTGQNYNSAGEGSEQGPTPIKNGNFENRNLGKRFKGHQLKDYHKNACFTCRKEGCIPWKNQGAAANNFQSWEDRDKDVSDTEENSNDS